MHDIDEMFWDSNVSIETIIWLPSCVCDHGHDDLTDMLESWPEEVVKAMGCPMYALEDTEGFLEWCGINRKHGFLVNAKTPADSSWGHCKLGWFYTDRLDTDFVEQLADWRGMVCESSVPPA